MDNYPKLALNMWRKIIKLRDKTCMRTKCPYCKNEPTKSLQAHHIIPANECGLLKYDTNNGILFCKATHFKWAESKNPYIMNQVIEFYMWDEEAKVDILYLFDIYEKWMDTQPKPRINYKEILDNLTEIYEKLEK